ncbi:MAG: tubulin-like doman-containing protein [Alphaproteobacteria bacterium]
MAELAQGEPGVGSQTLRELQPTVFVGLGGTGKEVLLRVRRQILSTRWKSLRLANLTKFPIAQFMYFDVDTQAAQESDRAAASDLLGNAVRFSPSETLQKFLDLQLFLNSRKAYPLIDEFFPNQELHGINVLHGAAQIRVLSRLYFFQHYGEFRSMLTAKARAAVASLQNREYMEKLGLKVDAANRYRVVIVASAAGGTGSGSFLDVGYLASSLQDPPPESVTLVLMLSGAFHDANITRVNANSFAALRELEGCMRNPESPRYVTRWSPNDEPLGQIYPYKDVYLIDSANLLRERTNNKDELFAMIASILFEDFGSSEFAQHKRSVATNNQNFKAHPYKPPMPAGYEGALAYSAAYSSFGQATLETTSRRLFERRNYALSIEMLQGFYGLGESRKAHTVTDEQLNEFLANQLHLDEIGYTVLADRRIRRFFPRPPAQLPPSLKLYSLVRRLLAKPDGSTLLKGVLERVEGALDTVKGSADFSQWKERVEDAFKDLEASLHGLVGSKDAAPRAREIEDAALRLKQDWTATGTLGIRGDVYRMVEDHQRGGIHYALDLLRQIKDRVGDRKHGVIGTLDEARIDFKAWAEKCQQALFDVPLHNLTELSGRHAHSHGALILAEGVKPLMSKYAELQLYALACGKAIELLESLSSEFIGRSDTQRDDGTPLWTGLLGEIDEGRRSLIDMIGELRREVAHLDDRRESPMRKYVEDGYKFSDPPSLEVVTRWAQQAFEHLHLDTGAIFEQLGTPEGKLKLMEDLRQWVRDQYQREEQELPSVAQALRALGDRARGELENLMHCAAPWVDADTQRMDGFKSEQCKMFIAVTEKSAFEHDFGTIVDSARPAGIQVSVVESNAPGKLICYSELSGIPLNTLTPVRSTYFEAYKRERDGMPLHNHRDYVRFPNPIVPDQAAINAQAETVKIYLQSIVFGILQRGSEPTRGETDDRAHGYFIQRKPGEWSSIGVERRILDAVSSENLALLRERVDEFDGQLQPIQCLALAALFRYYQRLVYPKTVVADYYQQDHEITRFESAVAGWLSREYLARYTGTLMDPGERQHAEQLVEAIQQRIDKWSREVPGSRADIASNGAKPTIRAKRSLLIDAFSEERLKQLLGPSEPGQPLAPSGPAPGARSPPPPAAQYHLAIDGKAVGPFAVEELRRRAAEGSFSRKTLVWVDGLSDWTQADHIAELSPLFDAGRRPPPLPN